MANSGHVYRRTKISNRLSAFCVHFSAFLTERGRCQLFFKLNWLSYSYKLIKCSLCAYVSVCLSVCLCQSMYIAGVWCWPLFWSVVSGMCGRQWFSLMLKLQWSMKLLQTSDQFITVFSRWTSPPPSAACHSVASFWLPPLRSSHTPPRVSCALLDFAWQIGDRLLPWIFRLWELA